MKRVIGYTGPSVFSGEIHSMIEDYYEACPIYINQNDTEHLDYLINQIHGLILAGGRDICPTSYGKEIFNGQALSNFDVARDTRESYLIEQCFKKNIPILGICRGHQILGVYHGISLIQNISWSTVCHSPGASKIELDGIPPHLLYIYKDFQKEFFEKDFVSSFHHQALPIPANAKESYKKVGIELLGYSYLNYDKQPVLINELMRGINNRWISCQSHPETEWSSNKAAEIILSKFKDMVE